MNQELEAGVMYTEFDGLCFDSSDTAESMGIEEMETTMDDVNDLMMESL